MLNEKEFQELTEDLLSTDLSMRVATLKVLSQDPLKDERLLPYLEGLLSDQTPCVVMFPYHFGEIRWLAAKALRAQRRAVGNNELMKLKDVVQPIDTEEFMKLAIAANIKVQSGVEGVLKSFALLRELELLPLYDLHY